LYFFATPTSGADIANWGIWITHLLANRNLQIEELQKMTSGSYLLDRVSDWLAAKFPFPSYCAYETVKTDGVLVVSSASALLLATERPDPINEDHITIVQPKDAKARAYIDFRNAFVRTIKGNSGINSHSAVSITVIPALPERHPGPSTQALISPPSEGTEPAVTNETPAAQTDENLYTVRYEYERTNHGFLISYRLPYLDLLQRGDPVIGKKYDKNPFLSEWPQLLTTVANNSARQVVITSVVLDIAKSYQRDDVILTVDDSSLNTLIFVNHGWGDVINPRLIFEVHRPQTSTPDFNSEKHELDLPAFKASHVVQIHKYIPQTMTQLDFVHVVGELQYGSNDDRRTLKFSTNVEQNAHFGAPLTPSDEEYGVFFKSGETGRFVVDLQVPRQIKPGEADTFYLRVGTDRSSLTQTNLGFLTNEGTEIEANELTLDLFVPRFADVKWQQGIIRKEK
jgi:hypothetical protein